MFDFINVVLAVEKLSVMATEEAAVTSGAVDWGVIGVFGAVLAAGIIVFGAARGIGQIACGAVDAIARQPEAGGRIFTSMIMACALIEGGMLFGLIICFMAVMWMK